MRCSNYFQNRAPFDSKIYIDGNILYINTSKLIKNDGNIRSLPFCRYLIIGFHAHAPKSQSAVLRNTWILHKHYCPIKEIVRSETENSCYVCFPLLFLQKQYISCGKVIAMWTRFVLPKGISQ